MSNRQSLLERFKQMERENPTKPYDPYPDQPEPTPVACSAREYGLFLRGVRVSMENALEALRASGIAEKDEDAFLEGLYGKRCVHFIGMQDSRQFRNACRMWGAPDYDWPTASFRILGDCAPHDVVVFGTSAFVKPKKWRAAT